MVYNWEGKEAECYRLYVDELRPLDEVIEHFRAKGFHPSKRAFQTQFKRWGFPTKQNPAYRNPRIVVRVKELWEKNTTQKDMLTILNQEGLRINERELMRVRTKNKWLLRVRNTKKQASKTNTDNTEEVVQDDRDVAELGQEDSMSDGESASEVPPDVLQQQQQNRERRQIESDERWRTRKRRRRTRSYGGLPADPEGPPRFPSETTLDESKAYLRLTNELYREVRDQFQAICEAEGVIKKTIAGPEKWAAVKDRLVRENEHLHRVFWHDDVDMHGGNLGEDDFHQSTGALRPERRMLSLDVICTDVTKRMRTLSQRITLADAKNALGLDPEQARAVRNSFHSIMRASHFPGKIEAGDEHWHRLRTRWIASQPVLAAVYAEPESMPGNAQRRRAVDFLCRDANKRFRDDVRRKGPAGASPQTATTGPGPGPAPPRMPPRSTLAANAAAEPSSTPAAAAAFQQSIAHHHHNHHHPTNPSNDSNNAPVTPNYPTDFQIDPTLLLAAAANTTTNNDNAAPAPPANPTPVFFRLHPSSPLRRPPHIWLAALRPGRRSLAEVRRLAGARHGGGGCVVGKVEGVVKDGDGDDGGGGSGGGEIAYPIDDEEELEGYLAHVGEGKATFVVRLEAVAA